jgi:predicted Zn-dependent peptidase
MIHFNAFTLANGLQVFHHYDASTPLAVINILYDVGARDEDPSKTGFAHLFEHLMFGGSINIPDYDTPLQEAGGENNAFTNNDITNYYLTLPAHNIETGFWLESDRMLSLAFSPQSLEVQRQVVIEEFKQRYLNQPYGDVWLRLRALAYREHPYRWATIGKEISHIENATLDDVKAFFNAHYHPGNAYLCVAGNISLDRVKELCEKWFAPIPGREKKSRLLPAEPPQTEARFEEVRADVPANAIYKAYHCCARTDADYYATDLLTDVLSRGRSSRLLNRLVKEEQLFTEINAYISGDMDPGLVIVEGKLCEGVDLHTADAAICRELQKLADHAVEPQELQKVKNKAEATMVFSEMSILNKAMGLCFGALLGDPDLMNREPELYAAVSATDLQRVASNLFKETNCSTLYYLRSN